jgi:hypothetical protein
VHRTGGSRPDDSRPDDSRPDGSGLSECARATARGEQRYRIDVPIAPARAARVIALDAGAAQLARRAAALDWAHARFHTCEAAARPDRADDTGLCGLGGEPAGIGEVLAGADLCVVVATDDTGRERAAAIGRRCAEAGTTTAAVVVGDGPVADDAVFALRPYARVLLHTADDRDVVEVLTALRV